MHDPEADGGLGSVSWEDEAPNLAGSSYEKAIEVATREREWVIKAWAPPHLGALLTKWFWKDERASVSMNKVWLDACRYLYLPRLLSTDVFTQAVRDGVAPRDSFGYAASEHAGDLQGLL